MRDQFIDAKRRLKVAHGIWLDLYNHGMDTSEVDKDIYDIQAEISSIYDNVRAKLGLLESRKLSLTDDRITVSDYIKPITYSWEDIK